MRLVTWAIRLVVFLLLVAFAAKNAEPVVLLLGFFAAGALFGIVALLGPLARQRREISALRKRVPPPAPAEPASNPAHSATDFR